MKENLDVFGYIKVLDRYNLIIKDFNASIFVSSQENQLLTVLHVSVS